MSSSIYCSQGHENSAGSRFCYRCGQSLPQNDPVGATQGLQSGTRLRDRYILRQQLGQGGFGRTYMAEDTGRFNEPVAVKELTPSMQGTYALQKAEELFQREAITLHRLQHPQIPRFWEIFQQDKRLFLVEDYVDGKTYQSLLNERLKSGQKFTEAEIIQLLRHILPVLAYLHSQGVIHRDISPDNIMRRAKDGMDILIDLGGVKQVSQDVETQIGGQNPNASGGGTRLGKVGYAPDEQMRMGLVAPNSDLYALAVTAVVLLTGKQPQQLIDPHSMQWIWNREITLSPPLNMILQRMLANRPSERFQSASEVLQQIDAMSSSSIPATISSSSVPATIINNNSQPQPAINNFNYNQAPVNTSGQSNNLDPSMPVPDEILGWNWGAFLLPGLWCFNNRVWIGLLSWVPYVGWIMIFILGAKGNEWAWKSRRWQSVEAFKANQRAWAKGGAIAYGVFSALFIALFIAALLLPTPETSNNPVSTPDSSTSEPSPTNTSPDTSTPDTSTPTPTNSQLPALGDLTVGEAYLARINAEGKLVPIQGNTYAKTEKVLFALSNAGKFKKGEDGKNFFDLDLEVVNWNNEVILSKKGLLGEQGRVDLPNNITESPNIPYGIFTPSPQTEAGEYTIKLTIYDKIDGRKVTKSTTFILE